jgi:hypothetical protein
MTFHRAARNAIIRHAPDDNAKRDALSRCVVALPFWSMLASMVIVRAIVRILVLPLYAPRPALMRGIVDGGVVGGGDRWRCWDVVYTTIDVLGLFIGPALAWMALGILVVLRYAGPFRPIGE